MNRPRRSAGQRFDFAATRRSPHASVRTPARAPVAPSNAVPDVYREMLAEACRDEPSRPQKRPAKRQRVEPPPPPPSTTDPAIANTSGARAGNDEPATTEKGPNGRLLSAGKTARAAPVISLPLAPAPAPVSTPADSDSDIEFEDIDLPQPAAIQTIVRDSDGDSDSDSASSDGDGDSDDDSGDGQVVDFSQLDFENLAQAHAAPSEQALDIDFSATASGGIAPSTRDSARRNRRPPLTREQKQQRIGVHQMHLLCLIWHCALRNHWCNDTKVQKTLKRLLTQRTRDLLCPKKKLSPFARTESIKRGLEMAGTMWRVKFRVTEKGMRRALWAASPEELAAHQVPDDLEMCATKEDFLEAAVTMAGSRDVGAQLYCAFLRAAGVRCRLVCSLQVLSFTASGPTMAAAKPQLTKAQLRKRDMDEKKRRAMELYQQQPPAPTTGMAALAHRRRVGASAASSSSSSRAPPPPSTATDGPIQRESPYPVFWVEVLDKGSQKWNPADPLVTKTFFRAKALEPPLSDKDNQLVYVLAFDDNGTVRDVTHRYTKAFKAKTRKLRIDHTVLPASSGSGSTSTSTSGYDWWHRVLAHYTRRKPPSALRLAEDAELAASLAREPMPKRIGDFRGHPDYVLARHIKRHEVLLASARARGTIKPTGAAALERVYSRADVRTVYTKEKWFLLGRKVRPDELPRPAKTLYRRRRRQTGGDDEPEGDEVMAVYTKDQTDAFRHPPVVDGRVPRNQFGNLEIYMASMVPLGGSYIAHKRATRAAHLLGIDYVPAVSGFDFRGRHGTAVMHGAVVAAEHAEAMEAVLAGMDDQHRDALEEKKRQVILKAWRRFILGLRIRAQVRASMGLDKKDRQTETAGTWPRKEQEPVGGNQDKQPAEARTEEQSESELSELSDGAFIIEDDDDGDDDDDDDMGGGFLVEGDDDDEMAGGFIVE